MLGPSGPRLYGPFACFAAQNAVGRLAHPVPDQGDRDEGQHEEHGEDNHEQAAEDETGPGDIAPCLLVVHQLIVRHRIQSAGSPEVLRALGRLGVADPSVVTFVGEVDEFVDEVQLGHGRAVLSSVRWWFGLGPQSRRFRSR